MSKKRLVTALTAALVAMASILLGIDGAAQSSSDVRFAVIGDFGSGGPGERAVSDLVDSWNVDFVATVGDNVYSSDSSSPKVALDEKVGNYYGKYVNDGNFFPALGNHDWGDPGVSLLDCSGSSCQGAWKNFFNLPGNERYYEVRRGPVSVFVIDDYYLEPDGNSADSTQGRWLKSAMANSDAKFKVVLHHFPAYSSTGGNKRMRWPFKEWGADAVAAGHVHTYERLDIDGLPYFVNGLGGASKHKIGSYASPESQKSYATDYGAMLVDVSDSAMTMKFISSDGTVVDSITKAADKSGSELAVATAAATDPVTGAEPEPVPKPALTANAVINPTSSALVSPMKADTQTAGYNLNPFPDSPQTEISAALTGPNSAGELAISGTAQYSEGVESVDIAVRNLDTNQYWNASTSSWQEKFSLAKVNPATSGSIETSWKYSVDKQNISSGNYRIRAWARGPRGNGDPFGDALLELPWL